jgi:hypothetical protein
MNLAPSILLAEVNRGAGLSESFRHRPGIDNDDVLLAVLMAAALLVGLWAASRLMGLRRQRRGYSSPRQLFLALCKAHHLTWSDRSLLARVARHHGLRDPGRLFLEFQRWDEQVLGPAFALELVRLRELRKQIFEGAGRGGTSGTLPRATAGVRNVNPGQKLDALLSDGTERRKSAITRSTHLGGESREEPPTTADHEHASRVPERRSGGAANVASPLFPALPAPTLDVPPWSETQNVEG